MPCRAWWLNRHESEHHLIFKSGGKYFGVRRSTPLTAIFWNSFANICANNNNANPSVERSRRANERSKFHRNFLFFHKISHGFELCFYHFRFLRFACFGLGKKTARAREKRFQWTPLDQQQQKNETKRKTIDAVTCYKIMMLGFIHAFRWSRTWLRNPIKKKKSPSLLEKVSLITRPRKVV